MEEVKQTLMSSMSASTLQYYNRVKASYLKFRKDKPNSEEIVLEWLTNESKTKAPTTLWSQLSLLCKYLEIEDNCLISRTNANKYLKVLELSHKKKQAPAFTYEELNTYLISHPNTGENLVNKLFVLFSYYGALRTSEAASLSFDSVTVVEEGIMLFIIRKKTDKAGIGETKLIPKNDNKLLCPVAIFDVYKQSVPQHERLWVKYDKKLEKFVRMPIGRNTLAKIASQVALFLKKNNAEMFTGHSFRVSSATVLADAGISTINLKRHAGWKSDSVAEGYIRNSKKQKVETASLLSNKTNIKEESSTVAVNFTNCVFNQCSINIEKTSQ